jgi:hypothetical protein
MCGRADVGCACGNDGRNEQSKVCCCKKSSGEFTPLLFLVGERRERRQGSRTIFAAI